MRHRVPMHEAVPPGVGSKPSQCPSWVWLYIDGCGSIGAHFGVGAPPILVYLSGDWDVHRGYDLDFDPWPAGVSWWWTWCRSLPGKSSYFRGHLCSMFQAPAHRATQCCPFVLFAGVSWDTAGTLDMRKRICKQVWRGFSIGFTCQGRHVFYSWKSAGGLRILLPGKQPEKVSIKRLEVNILVAHSLFN